MNGVDITTSAVSGSTITIAEVTGDITITASGVLGNLIDYFGYTDGQRISTGDGGNRTKAGCTTIEYIKLSEFIDNGTVSFHITGAQFIHKSNPWDDNAYVFYNASKTFTVGGYLSGIGTHGNIKIISTSTSDTDMTITITGLTTAALTSSYSYLRVCGIGSGANINIRSVKLNVLLTTLDTDGASIYPTVSHSSLATIGYASGYRLGSGGTESAASGKYVTGFIPVKQGDKIILENISVNGTTQDNDYIALYDSSMNKLYARYGYTWITQTGDMFAPHTIENGVITSFTLTGGTYAGTSYDFSNVAYMRLSASNISSNSAIYIE